MMKNTIILDADQHIEFDSIYEAINKCFGKNYKAWMRGCWPNYNPENQIRAWFPKLAPKKKDEYIPAAHGCINTISDDWNTFIFDDLKKTDNGSEDYYTGYDLIFAKDVGGKYVFRGVFKVDLYETTYNHLVSKRIAKRVELIGDPYTKLKFI